MTLEADVLHEIVDLHAFFTGWFGGSVPKTEANFARFKDALDPGFGQVNPVGTFRPYETILRDVWAHWNWYPGDPNYRIWIENAGVRHVIAGDHAVAVYEEWQTHKGETIGRTCTAVLARRAGAPTGIAWLEMHESLFPGGRRPD